MEFVGFILVLVAMVLFIYALVNLAKFIIGIMKFQFRVKNLLIFLLSFSLIIGVKLIIDNNSELLKFEVIHKKASLEFKGKDRGLLGHRVIDVDTPREG
ncbi:hypothetical protein [Grimontia marina]|uniref:Uncharacterized protein n=1 Tax=Grimontia marina TaxID=646534 RepID=A0A128FIR4_9GAMM|nr:hypothetical protein [Grimontia marina]CZF86682.1 hypothetical protein GMA8713_04720 [Grimontia marina]